ncbi:MAG: hypothetical protein PHQ05_13250 [Sterolibacterium sp.]|nr:hypothetical protein [Sterolibacterium sp.]
MATRNSKPTLVREASDSTTLVFNPASNPLSHQSPEDTMRSVHAVLGFLSCSMTAMMEQSACEFNIADEDIGGGIKLILDTCCVALSSNISVEGGAA